MNMTLQHKWLNNTSLFPIEVQFVSSESILQHESSPPQNGCCGNLVYHLPCMVQQTAIHNGARDMS